MLARTTFICVLAACSSSSQSGPTPAPAPAPAKAEPAPVAAQPDEAAAVARLIGTKPPEWRVERWLNSEPRTLDGWRGDVVLVRWWTSGCPYCATSAPALRTFDATYRAKGLRVIGIYHHKDDTPFDPAVYEAMTKKYGFTFPVAFDPDWRTFRDWMRDAKGDKVDTGWTSVTFLLDRKGVIRHVHPGGSYAEGEPGFAKMTNVIETLLAEPET